MTFNHYVDEKLGIFTNMNIHSIQVSQISYTFLFSNTASDGIEWAKALPASAASVASASAPAASREKKKRKHY